MQPLCGIYLPSCSKTACFCWSENHIFPGKRSSKFSKEFLVFPEPKKNENVMFHFDIKQHCCLGFCLQVYRFPRLCLNLLLTPPAFSGLSLIAPFAVPTYRRYKLCCSCTEPCTTTSCWHPHVTKAAWTAEVFKTWLDDTLSNPVWLHGWPCFERRLDYRPLEVPSSLSYPVILPTCWGTQPLMLEHK